MNVGINIGFAQTEGKYRVELVLPTAGSVYPNERLTAQITTFLDKYKPPEPGQPPPPLSPEDWVYIGNVTVRFEVKDEAGNTVDLNIPQGLKTDDKGWLQISFNAPSREGKYTVTAYAVIEGVECSDSGPILVSKEERPPVPTPTPTPQPTKTLVFEAQHFYIALVIILSVAVVLAVVLAIRRRRKFLVASIAVLAIAVVLAYGVQFAMPPTPTIPTSTPKPTSLIGFEEAVEYALNPRGPPRWETFSEYRSLSGFKGKPFVTPDGLEEGYLMWRASNGDLYEAEYPSGKVRERIEQFIGAKDTEEYYAWRIELKDGIPCYIDARNGELLIMMATRVPGVLTFKTAARIVYAPQKRVEEWKVQEYQRVGNFEFEPHKTSDGLVKGHLLWRTSDGTLYEVEPPFILDTSRKVLYIKVLEDREEYNLWEITTEENIYYIDARNGVIRLTLPTHPFVPTHPTKLLPAYTLKITFPDEEGYVSIKKGQSVTLPVAIKSLVDEPIRIRLVLLSSPSREEPLPKFITYETEGYITINPHAAVQTQITIKVSEDAPLGEYSFELTGELEKPVEGWGGEGYVFGVTIAS